MRSYISYISVCAILFVAGCVTDPTPNEPYDPGLYALDSNIYFRIHFRGDTLKTYGIKSLFMPTNGPILRGSYYIKVLRTIDNLGNPNNNMSLECLGSLGNLVIAGTYLPKNQCDFKAGAIKPGSYEGNYYFTSTPELTDLTDSSRHLYPVDINFPYQFTITRADSQYFGGHFNFYLLDGNTRIPASGQFQLNNLY